jgi:hypothetical protein
MFPPGRSKFKVPLMWISSTFVSSLTDPAMLRYRRPEGSATGRAQGRLEPSGPAITIGDVPDPTNRLVAIRTADAEVADPCPWRGGAGAPVLDPLARPVRRVRAGGRELLRGTGRLRVSPPGTEPGIGA